MKNGCGRPQDLVFEIIAPLNLEVRVLITNVSFSSIELRQRSRYRVASEFLDPSNI